MIKIYFLPDPNVAAGLENIITKKSSTKVVLDNQHFLKELFKLQMMKKKTNYCYLGVKWPFFKSAKAKGKPRNKGQK